MKLKGRELPFWAVKRKGSSSFKRYECLRFFKYDPRYYYYDAKILINGWTGGFGPPQWSSFNLLVQIRRLAKSTTQGFSELTTLPSNAKQRFVVELFKLIK